MEFRYILICQDIASQNSKPFIIRATFPDLIRPVSRRIINVDCKKLSDIYAKSLLPTFSVVYLGRIERRGRLKH